MSIIGPRPLLVKYLPFYKENERIRHQVRPEEQNFINISTSKGKWKLAWHNFPLFLDICFKKICNKKFGKPIIYDYEKTCEQIVSRDPYFSNAVPGMFTSWDAFSFPCFANIFICSMLFNKYTN